MSNFSDCLISQNYNWYKNYSIWNSSRNLIESYLCRYENFLNFKRISGSVESHLVLLFGLFGFLGGFSTIATLTQKSFRVADYFLFRLIGYLETVQMAVVTSMSVFGFLRCDLSYACTFFWAHVATTVTNVCADVVDLIVLFLCVERTVACVLPHFFHLFHTSKCWTIVAAWSLILPLLFSIFQAFELQVIYDEMNQRFIDEPTKFSQTNFYELLVKINTIRFYVTAVLIATATVCSIIGFTLMARRKKKLLQHNNSTMSPSNQQTSLISMKSTTDRSSRSGTDTNELAKRATKLQRDLCCLQMCLAGPVVINHMLYAMGLNTTYSFIYGKAAFDRNLSYETALDELWRAKSFIYLRLSTNISNVLGHGLHFYLYLLFSLKVRRGFANLLKTCKKETFRKRRSGKSGTNAIMIEDCVGRRTALLTEQ